MQLKNKTRTEEVKEIIKTSNLRHVAIIMDGNRRWAQKYNKPSSFGHKAGVDTLKNIIKLCYKWEIKYLTVYAFSTENWGRKEEEVSFLMFLLNETIRKETKELHKKNVRIRTIGNLRQLREELQETLISSMEITKNNTGLNLQIAINYGSRDELCNAIKNIAKDVKSNVIDVEQIDHNLVSEYLYTKDIPDPEILIRTAGEYRISNYLLWQIAYTELYVTQTLWPEFDESDFEKSIQEFAQRERRFGRG